MSRAGNVGETGGLTRSPPELRPRGATHRACHHVGMSIADTRDLPHWIATAETPTNMKTFLKTAKYLTADERAVTTAEYAVLMTFLTVGTIAVVSALGRTIGEFFESTASDLDSN